MSEGPQAEGSPARGKKAVRAARLAEALRENLRKRRRQKEAREMAGAPAERDGTGARSPRS